MNIKRVARSVKPESEPEDSKNKREFTPPSTLGCVLTFVLTCIALFFTGNLVASAFPSDTYGANHFDSLGALVARLGLAFFAVIIVVGGLLYLLFAKLLPRKE